jgi:hypothetical protein
MELDLVKLETFFVYRSLHSDESWGTVLGDAPISNLPNADFVMKVFATNEKEAISKARKLYDKIHHYDSDKDNVRRFACAALKAMVGIHDPETAGIQAMKYAIGMNSEFTKHFNELNKLIEVEDAIEQAQRERKEVERQGRKLLEANGEIRNDNFK